MCEKISALLAYLELALPLIWDAHLILGKSGRGAFVNFMISRPILLGSDW